MFQATRMPTFATVVGVAPSTTTMTLGASCWPVEQPGMVAIQDRADAIMPATPAPPTSSQPWPTTPSQSQQRRRYYVPYSSLEDLRSSGLGLGIVNESDAWLTGRPYGLPGTSTIRLDQRPGGYHSPAGHHYDASMVGGGFGDAGTDTVLALQQIVEAQKAQQASLKRIAFWQGLGGGIMIGSVALSAVFGVLAFRKSRAGLGCGPRGRGRGGR